MVESTLWKKVPGVGRYLTLEFQAVVAQRRSPVPNIQILLYPKPVILAMLPGWSDPSQERRDLDICLWAGPSPRAGG